MKQGSVQFTIFVSSQEIVKVRELIPHIGPLTKVIFLDIVLNSSTDIITRALRGCFRGGSVIFTFVSFRFKAKKNLQRCGDVFFDILITSKGASALGMF